MKENQIKNYLKKHVIIGITYLDHNENLIEQKQLHGDIVRINENEGIVVRINGSDEEFKLPPDLSTLKKAPPGEYKFKSTGEVVINPDFMTTWTVKKPKPE